MEEDTVDVFKVLSHPTRRKILMFIAEHQGASYSELSKIVPKAGALYHHLRLLGDLIYQDENKVYRLTKKGEKVYEFLASDFFVPKDQSIHLFLTPRPILEKVEGSIALGFIIIFVVTSFLWILDRTLVPVFLLVIPLQLSLENLVLVYTNYFVSALAIKFLIRAMHGRNVPVEEVLIKQSLAFTLMNLYPIFFVINNQAVLYCGYLVLQFFTLLFMIAAVSVVSRLPLRSSLAIVIIVHYISMIICIILLGLITISI